MKHDCIIVQTINLRKAKISLLGEFADAKRIKIVFTNEEVFHIIIRYFESTSNVTVKAAI